MKTTVEIEWDSPQQQEWLCPDNIALALHAYCRNTRFKVRCVGRSNSPKMSVHVTEALSHLGASHFPTTKPAVERQRGWSTLQVKLFIGAFAAWALFVGFCVGQYFR